MVKKNLLKFNIMDAKTEIIHWFNSTRNYMEGVGLYNMYSKNKALQRYFKGEENKQRMEKLVWELHKIAGLPDAVCYDASAIKPFFPVLPKPIAKEKKREQDAPKEQTKKFPEPVKILIKEKGDLYSQRDKLHTSLSELGESNDEIARTKRQEIIESVEKMSVRIEYLIKVINHFVETGELNTEPDPPAEEKPEVKKEASEMSEAEAIKRITNLRTYRAKCSKKIAELKDTPGPKLDKEKSKLKEFEKELKELETKFKINK